MNYLVDTDCVIPYLKGRDEAVRLLMSLVVDGLAISLITYGEIYEGIFYGRNTESQEQGFLRFLRGVELLPLNPEIMKQFARIRGALRAEGQLIGDPDILIAATAIHHKLTLVTYNVRHFQRIPELRLYPPFVASG